MLYDSITGILADLSPSCGSSSRQHNFPSLRQLTAVNCVLEEPDRALVIDD